MTQLSSITLMMTRRPNIHRQITTDDSAPLATTWKRQWSTIYLFSIARKARKGHVITSRIFYPSISGFFKPFPLLCKNCIKTKQQILAPQVPPPTGDLLISFLSPPPGQVVLRPMCNTDTTNSPNHSRSSK
jgi:hypothetical protein